MGLLGVILLAALYLASAGPLAEASPTAIRSIAAGGAHSCAVAADGALACWGYDSAGQVSGTPAGEFQSVATGDAHSCAIAVDGSLACWGDDSAGQVSGAPEGEFQSVAAGEADSCAVAVDGTLSCWGDDSSGQVSGTPAGRFLSVSAGRAFNCAVSVHGALVCWGDDSAGQVSGAPATGHSHSWPWHWWHWHHHHHHLPSALLVSAGNAHACAILDGGALTCWGDDSSGQVSEAPEGEFQSVAAGGAHSCAVAVDGTLACWGDDSSGQVSEAPEGEFQSVAAGRAHSCALDDDEAVVCWGDNGPGESKPAILGPGPPEGTVGTAYLHAFGTTPQSPAPHFHVTGGQLPDGLELSDSGELSGSPTTPGTFTFVVAGDGIAPEATRQVTVEIAAAADIAATGLPQPEAGKTVNVKPAGGTVKIKCPGKATAKLLSPEQIPIECLIDVRQGTVDLESSTGSGSNSDTRSGLFWGGIFGVLQTSSHNWDTELRLAGRLKCEKRRGGGSHGRGRVFKRSGGSGRKLWGSGKGNFKTSGNYGSASVRGTTWLVIDRCDNSTVFEVAEGTVWVHDFVTKHLVVLHVGERYVAKAAIRRLR